MKLNYKGKDINVEVIGCFLEDNTKYSVGTYIDGDGIKQTIILRTYGEGNGLKTEPVDDSEFDSLYNKFLGK